MKQNKVIKQLSNNYVITFLKDTKRNVKQISVFSSLAEDGIYNKPI